MRYVVLVTKGDDIATVTISILYVCHLTTGPCVITKNPFCTDGCVLTKGHVKVLSIGKLLLSVDPLVGLNPGYFCNLPCVMMELA